MKKGRIRVVVFPTSRTTENVYIPNNTNANGAVGTGGFKTSAFVLYKGPISAPVPPT